MTPAEVLAAHGILRALEVVELATAARLDLACAAVLLVKESSGGRNVWGHDDVPTGDAYDKGDVVTRADYLAYRAAVRAGKAGRQGCGPAQLTYGPYQDRADVLGGCWDWRINCRVGFAVLRELIVSHGERGGFARYNGSGPAAERYADDAMTRLKTWRVLLAAVTPAKASPKEDDVALSDDDIERIAKALAREVWAYPILNGFGDTVEAQQILVAAEKRTDDVLDVVQRLAAKGKAK